MTRIEQLELSPKALCWISDPGHGWLAVPLAEYPDALESGTGFGYLTRSHAFLEEDVEATDFLKRHPEIDYRDLPDNYVESLDRNGRRIPDRLNLTGQPA